MHPAGLTEATMWKQSGKMERYELALIAGVAVFLCGLIVFFERVLGAEPPTGFQSQPVPIFCGPATALREQLIKSQSRPIFTGQALDGAFMIFQPHHRIDRSWSRFGVAVLGVLLQQVLAHKFIHIITGL